MRRTLISFLFMLVCVSVTAAQDPTDVPFIGPIGFGQTVEDTLTPGAFFDWWQITLRRGDAIRVDMGGLEPLLGLLNENQDLVVRGEDGLPDSSVFITYEAPADGLYTMKRLPMACTRLWQLGSAMPMVRAAVPTACACCCSMRLFPPRMISRTSRSAARIRPKSKRRRCSAYA